MWRLFFGLIVADLLVIPYLLEECIKLTCAIDAEVAIYIAGALLALTVIIFIIALSLSIWRARISLNGRIVTLFVFYGVLVAICVAVFFLLAAAATISR